MNLLDRLKLLRSDGIIPKAAIYARFSSDNQREESIDAQLRMAREFAQNNGIIITNEYIDRAKSATTDDREEFQKMIRDAAAKSFNFVIVSKYDRFARNRHDAIGYRFELQKHGVKLVSVLESFDNETPEGALLEGVLESMNEFYSKNLAREVMKGLRENAYKALSNGGIPPYGYDTDPQTHKYVINPHEAEGVRLIFSMLQKRYSYSEIIDALHAKGFRTKSGGFFKHNSLHDILVNPRYTGLYTYMRRSPKNTISKTRNNHKYNSDNIVIKVPNGMPVIISQELFNEVQTILNSRKSTRKSKKNSSYLLKGKIICSNCGAPYCIDRVKRKNGTNYYVSYRCNSRKIRTGQRCSNLSVSQEFLDSKVISVLSDMIFDHSLIPKLLEMYNSALAKNIEQQSNVVKGLEHAIKVKDKAINSILKNLERIVSDTLTERLVVLEAEKKQLQEQLDELRNNSSITPIDVPKLTAKIHEAKVLFTTKPNDDNVKRLVDAFVDKIVVFPDHVEVVLNPMSFAPNTEYAKINFKLDRR